MPISSALRRVYVSAPSDTQYLETLELSHPAWPKTYGFVAAPVGFVGGTSRGNVTFEPLPFSVKLPKSAGEGGLDLTISIVNAGLEAMRLLELASTQPSQPIRVTFRVYVDSDTTTPASDEIVMDASATADDTSIVLTATPADLLNVGWPRFKYTQTLYPGLNR